MSASTPILTRSLRERAVAEYRRVTAENEEREQEQERERRAVMAMALRERVKKILDIDLVPGQIQFTNDGAVYLEVDGLIFSGKENVLAIFESIDDIEDGGYCQLVYGLFDVGQYYERKAGQS